MQPWAWRLVPVGVVDAVGIDPGVPRGVVGQLVVVWSDGAPHRMPIPPEPGGEGRHRGSVALDAADRPPRRPRRQLRPRPGQQMIFAESTDWAGPLQAAVAALPPQQLDRGTEHGDIVQPAEPAPMPGRDVRVVLSIGGNVFALR